MVIELILAEDIEDGVAKSGDTIVLKDDGTFEINKLNDKPFESDPTHTEDKLEKEEETDDNEKKECDKKESLKTEKKYDPRIEKYLSIEKERSWELLTKFYNAGHLDPYKILKEFINKIATCPDITEQFEELMEGWMKEGEADVSSIEKIIEACKKEEGNVEKEVKKEVTKLQTKKHSKKTANKKTVK